MSITRPIHKRVLAANNLDELAAVYADWAVSYDTDLVGEMGYRAPFIVAGLLHSNLESAPDLAPELTGARILDAGCGTGLVGQELSRLGYKQLVGLDYSTDMLAHARQKNVYQKLLQCDLMKKLDFEDDRFDAVACVGTLTLGHVGPSALRELSRVTKPGGFICFTVRDEAWVQEEYESALGSYSDERVFAVLQVRQMPYIEEEGSACRLCLVKALAV